MKLVHSTLNKPLPLRTDVLAHPVPSALDFNVSRQGLQQQVGTQSESTTLQEASSNLQPSLDNARDVWAAANAVQKHIEGQLQRMQLPAPGAEGYATNRLQQVSELSRNMDRMYQELFKLVCHAKPAAHSCSCRGLS
jgi:hypothetical protein